MCKYTYGRLKSYLNIRFLKNERYILLHIKIDESVKHFHKLKSKLLGTCYQDYQDFICHLILTLILLTYHTTLVTLCHILLHILHVYVCTIALTKNVFLRYPPSALLHSPYYIAFAFKTLF